MNGDFPDALRRTASIRTCGTRRPFEHDQKHGWRFLRISADFRCCQAFLGEKSPSNEQVPERTSSKSCGRPWGHLFWCMETQQSIVVGSRQIANPCLRSDQPTSSPRADRHGSTQNLRDVPKRRDGIGASLKFDFGSRNPCGNQETSFRSRKGSSDSNPTFGSGRSTILQLPIITPSFNRDHLVQALAPLYRGMTHSFLVEHADSSPAEIEAANEMLCAEFELQKPYLRERWKAKVEVKS